MDADVVPGCRPALLARGGFDGLQHSGKQLRGRERTGSGQPVIENEEGDAADRMTRRCRELCCEALSALMVIKLTGQGDVGTASVLSQRGEDVGIADVAAGGRDD